MKIPPLIVNARFLTQPTTGVQRFAIEISKQINRLFPQVHFIAPRNILYPELANKLNVRVIGKLSGHLWEQTELPCFLRRHKTPYLLNLANTAPLWYPNNFVTIHDMAVFDFPSAYSKYFRQYYQFLLPRVSSGAKKVFTVSEFSRKRVQAILKTSSEVIYNSVHENFIHTFPTSKEKYILAVSSLDPKKNFSGLVNGFLQANMEGYTLKVIGAPNRVFSGNSDFVQHSGVHFTGYVKDEELKQLYQKATAFIYPSLYEGFGIPPLEAMASGCPTIVSDIPSLREVCADASLYINPNDPKDIAKKIEDICYNSELQTYLQAKGLENIKRFSWEESAFKLMRHIAEATDEAQI